MATPKPEWLRRKIPGTAVLARMKGLFKEFDLHTVCESARCPNQGECFGRGVATFMILGNICTRSCRFCAVEHGKPLPVDEEEPEHVAQAVRALGLKYVVTTSVTRDDLPDGGASHFALVVQALHKLSPRVAVEVLIPDFGGSQDSLRLTVESCPEVVSHNLETVPRLYPEVRPQADYIRSLEVLQRARGLGASLTKSGLMVGLGETIGEIREVMRDLRRASCDFITLGQYLKPTSSHHEIVRFVPPEEFEVYREMAREMGFKGVASAPLVRSSFLADRMFSEAQ